MARYLYDPFLTLIPVYSPKRTIFLVLSNIRRVTRNCAIGLYTFKTKEKVTTLQVNTEHGRGYADRPAEDVLSFAYVVNTGPSHNIELCNPFM